MRRRLLLCLLSLSVGAASVLVGATAPAAWARARPSPVGAAGTLQCTVAGRVKFSPPLSTGAPAATHVTVKATLACSMGTTGQPGVNVTAGKLTSSSTVDTSCTSTTLGAITAVAKWRTAKGRIASSSVSWSGGAISGSSAAVVDLPGFGGSAVTGSYGGEGTLMLHLQSAPLAGGRCGRPALRGFSLAGGGASTLSLTDPAVWNGTDVGGAQPAGVDDTSGGTWSEQGGGGDIWGTADSFHLLARSVAGDGAVTARVVSQQATDPWAKAGPMVRTSADPGSPYYAALVTPGNGLSVQWRGTQGASTTQVLAPGTAPLFVRISRDTPAGSVDGSLYSAFTSPDGSTWSAVPGSTVSLDLGPQTLAGLAVTSHVQGTGSAVTFDSVALESGASTPPGLACPSGWTCTDVGGATPAGDQVLAAGTWTVDGGGGDIWGSADAFHLVGQSMAGDGSMAAEVLSQSPTDPWAKSGIVMRASADPGAPYYGVFVTPGNGVVVQWRLAQDAPTSNAQITATAPLFLQVTRSGTTFSASTSPDGVVWTPVPGSSTTVPTMTGAVVRGFAVTSHDPSEDSTVVFGSLATTG